MTTWVQGRTGPSSRHGLDQRRLCHAEYGPSWMRQPLPRPCCVPSLLAYPARRTLAAGAGFQPAAFLRHPGLSRLQKETRDGSRSAQQQDG